MAPATQVVLTMLVVACAAFLICRLLCITAVVGVIGWVLVLFVSQVSQPYTAEAVSWFVVFVAIAWALDLVTNWSMRPTQIAGFQMEPASFLYSDPLIHTIIVPQRAASR